MVHLYFIVFMTISVIYQNSSSSISCTVETESIPSSIPNTDSVSLGEPQNDLSALFFLWLCLHKAFVTEVGRQLLYMSATSKTCQILAECRPPWWLSVSVLPSAELLQGLPLIRASCELFSDPACSCSRRMTIAKGHSAISPAASSAHRQTSENIKIGGNSILLLGLFKMTGLLCSEMCLVKSHFTHIWRLFKKFSKFLTGSGKRGASFECFDATVSLHTRQKSFWKRQQ